jgi:hypothetical protein
MVQMAIHQVIHVVAVRDGGMATIRAVHMILGVTVACMSTGARCRIDRRDFQCMLLDNAVRCLMMQMAIMQIVDVIAVLDRGVPAVRAMDVVVMFMSVCHLFFSKFLSVVAKGFHQPFVFSFSQPWASPLAIN